MDSPLLERTEGALRVLALNRPERRNALNIEMCERLTHALRGAADDSAIGAVLLRGEGPAFCVGGDVKAMAEGAGRELTPEQRMRSLRSRMEASRLLHVMPKPTVAALHGAAAGAGLALALACDFRVVGRSTKITTAFAKVALSGDFGGSWFLTRIVGAARARDLYLRPRVIGADEALAIGLVSEVVDDDRLQQHALAFAAELARGPRVTLGYMKHNLNQAISGTLESTLDLEALHHTLSAATDDHREAAAAFVEKREPRFSGR
ncbi:MAG: enoyl-CoA hydratase/isomerase family protein [Ideonella sp.]|nr:enoyl-CoA hydratase/isomerase family protein [Ideonella sp.]MCC7457585.1 enoyl-CoA hydratase/isomerase family protein [Nitrospira sp.]